MALPIIFLITVPVILGIAYIHPFDLVEKPPQEAISEEYNVNILYLILIVVWIFFLLRILIRFKKGTFKVTNRY
ncbi:hypothetical protein K0U27_04540 [archaeon]|nr:hypothetical protein [archaeon]